MTPLTADEKTQIVRAFFELQAALQTGIDIEPCFRKFQATYRGESRAYVDGFPEVPDDEKGGWLFVLRTHLNDEIEAEFWNAPLMKRPPAAN